MKKILYSLIAVLAMVMSSCSNDDIEISRQTTFKINPATVVEGLYEYNAGDMQSLYNNEKLNIALFIYDRNGNLVNNDLQQFSAYTQIMTSNQMLPKGDYTGIAVSYVSSSIEYWEIVNTEKMSTFKINDKGKILPRRTTGACAKHQRDITLAVKRARHIAILPYTTKD